MTDCPDCGAAPGSTHESGCDVERCSACGLQRASCGCPTSSHDADAVRWTGEWPMAAECRQLGWYARMDGGRWVECAAGDPGATEDLNRYVGHLIALRESL